MRAAVLFFRHDQGRRHPVTAVPKCGPQKEFHIVMRHTDDMPATTCVSAVSPRCRRACRGRTDRPESSSAR